MNVELRLTMLFLLIFAFVSAIPLNHVLEDADLEAFVLPKLKKVI